MYMNTSREYTVSYRWMFYYHIFTNYIINICVFVSVGLLPGSLGVNPGEGGDMSPSPPPIFGRGTKIAISPIISLSPNLYN